MRTRRAGVKTLLVLRHAKSSHDDPEVDDHERPLNPRGRADAKRQGRVLAREGVVPDAVVCSTALRALDTAERTTAEAGFPGAIVRERRLYLADVDEIVAVLRGLPDSFASVLVVGHNPGLEDLVESLTGRRERLPTAAIARLTLPISRWADLTPRTRATLESFRRAKDLD